MNIKINFEDTYDIVSISSDLTEMIFISPQVLGQFTEIIVKIEPYDEVNLPTVHNLGFGPKNNDGGFDDSISLRHQNYNKVFSTILLYGYFFLKEKPYLTLGIDGSDDRRAAVYHKMYINNRRYLEEYFQAIGVDWYVRVFRDWTYESDDDGNLINRPRPEAFNYDRTWHDLYRYYMFALNK